MRKPIPFPLEVAAKAAIIEPNGSVLIIREAATGKDTTKVGKWGLVGGRINPAESFFGGLRREIKEETGLLVQPVKPLFLGEWRPVIRNREHHIVAVFMLCRAETAQVKLSAEHDNFAWIKPGERSRFPMMEPDCFVVDALSPLRIGKKYYTDGNGIFKFDHTPIPADEPLILFRGRDNLVLKMLEYYKRLRLEISEPKQTNIPLLQADIDNITVWQKANPDKVRTPR